MNNHKLLLDDVDVSINWVTEKVNIEKHRYVAIHFIYSGANVNGTITVEASNDGLNWTTINGSALVVTSTGSYMFNYTLAGFQYIRAVWTAGTAPVGVLSAEIQLKDIR